MSTLYSVCGQCNGRGDLTCAACKCTACGSTGIVRCSHCSGGLVACQRCGGNRTISVEERHLFFFTRNVSRTCPDCLYGRIRCRVCEASSRMGCPHCQGHDHQTVCDACGGSRKIGCPTCNATGRLPGNWILSLPSMPPETLRFEHEKLRSRRGNLEIKLSRLHNDYGREESEYGDWSERARIEGWSLDHHGFWERLEQCRDAISSCQLEIAEAEEAMRLVEAHLQSTSQSAI